MKVELPLTVLLKTKFDKQLSSSLLLKWKTVIQQFITEMDWQSFTPRKTGTGQDILLEIPRNHLNKIWVQIFNNQAEVNKN